MNVYIPCRSVRWDWTFLTDSPPRWVRTITGVSQHCGIHWHTSYVGVRQDSWVDNDLSADFHKLINTYQCSDDIKLFLILKSVHIPHSYIFLRIKSLIHDGLICFPCVKDFSLTDNICKPFVVQPSIELLELMGVVRENGNDQTSLPPVVRT